MSGLVRRPSDEASRKTVTYEQRQARLAARPPSTGEEELLNLLSRRRAHGVHPAHDLSAGEGLAVIDPKDDLILSEETQNRDSASKHEIFR